MHGFVHVKYSLVWIVLVVVVFFLGCLVVLLGVRRGGLLVVKFVVGAWIVGVIGF